MKNIVLIGMAGCGKSTTGIVLAKKLGMSFIDTDIIIQEKTGKLLSQIIEEQSRDGFNSLENEILSKVNVKNSVIATGGSAVYGGDAMKNLLKNSICIYLRLPYEQIEKRVGDIKKRGISIKEGHTLKQTFEERVPLYEKYADIIFDTENYELRECVEKLTKKIVEKQH